MPYKDPIKAKACAARFRISPRGRSSQRKRNIAFRSKPENKENARLYGYAYRQTEKGKLSMLKGRLKKYSLTPEGYEKIFEQQKGICFFCGLSPRLGLPLDVEHDHACCNGPYSCGECIRGLVHRRCNSFIAVVEKYSEQVEQFVLKSVILRAR